MSIEINDKPNKIYKMSTEINANYVLNKINKITKRHDFPYS